MRCCLLLILLSYFLGVHAQLIPDPAPFQSNIETEKKFQTDLKARFQEDVTALKSPHKKYIVDIYKERYEYIKERLDNSEIITDTSVQSYLSSLIQVIVQNNPVITQPEKLRIYFSNTWWANAASFGEGTILFNIGLFHRLENEAQVAFVLCHELAHYYLNHSNTSIHQYVNTLYSDEMQQELKKIDKAEYNRNHHLDKLALHLGFKNRRHNREHERSADSMALELMKNTPFDIKEVLSCLSILDVADKEKYHTSLQLDQLWNFTNFPFKKRWLEANTLTFVSSQEEKAKNKVLEDSLKTHPDCQVRKATLEKMMTDFSQKHAKAFLVDKQKFDLLKRAFDFQVLESSFAANKVSTCLYTALQMHKAYPTNSYVNGVIGKCLSRIYTAQKQHELGKIIELPNEAFDEEYNKLLHLLQNIRLSELAAINYYFMEAYTPSGKQSETFLKALIKSKENFEKQEETSYWLQYYNNQISNKKQIP